MSFLSRRYKVPRGEEEDSTGIGKKKERRRRVGDMMREEVR
jgi:hypothetical protein